MGLPIRVSIYLAAEYPNLRGNESQRSIGITYKGSQSRYGGIHHSGYRFIHLIFGYVLGEAVSLQAGVTSLQLYQVFHTPRI